MRMQGKTDAALKWARTWPRLDDLLKLNAIIEDDEDATFTTVYSDAKGEPFIDGTARHEYTFGLRIMLPWSDGTDEQNADAMRLVEEWRDWVDEQFPDNVPDWDCEIEDIRALYDVPAVNVYQEDSLAEYNFLSKIIYTE